MRAVRYREVGGPLELVEVPNPPCPVDGAVIEVRVSGVCRSDWHAWRGHEAVDLPHVPGHEFSGVVAEVGPDVRGFVVGQRVTAPFVNGCGTCEWCRAGQAQVCPAQSQPGFTHPGSFAERVVVHAADTNLVAIPDAVDDLAAAALGCRFATAYRGLTVRGGLQEGEQLAVIGCGGVGLSAIAIGIALGAEVFAVDPSPVAMARAAELGATAVSSDAAVRSDVVSEVRRLSGGGVHVSVDAYGSAATAYTSVSVLRRQGRHVQIGLLLDADAHAGLPWEQIVSQELTVLGSHGMAAADYPELLDLIVAGRLDPSVLVGAEIGLEGAGAALAAMDDPVAAHAGTVIIRI